MNQLNKTDLFRALESIPTQEQIEEMEKKSKAQTEAICKIIRDERKRAESEKARADYWHEVAEGMAIQNEQETRETLAAARNAERAALRAETAAKRKAKEEALDADLVDTFKEFDAALNDETGEQLEIAAEVIREAKEKGRMLGSGGTRLFLRWWRGWAKANRPTARQYTEMCKRGRRPE
jgi:hypothetical protein